MVAIPITPGMTEWSVAQQYGVPVSAVEAANPGSPTDLQVGDTLIVPTGGSWAPSSSSTSQPSTSQSGGSSASGGGGSAGSSSSSSGGYHIPGVSDATAACIAMKESSDGAASWNVFQITPGSGYTVTPGMSLAQQEQVAGEVAANQGVQSAWGKYDGC